MIREETEPATGGFPMFGYQPLQPFGGNPYQDQLARMQMQPQSVTRVSGIDSARQLRLPPNSSMFALDYDDQHIYAVFTDGAGVVTAKPYLLKECDEPQAAGSYVTAEQFEQWKGEIDERISKLQQAGPDGD